MTHGPLWRLWKLCGSFQNPETLGAVSVVEISTASAPPTAYYDFFKPFLSFWRGNEKGCTP